MDFDDLELLQANSAFSIAGGPRKPPAVPAPTVSNAFIRPSGPRTIAPNLQQQGFALQRHPAAGAQPASTVASPKLPSPRPVAPAVVSAIPTNSSLAFNKPPETPPRGFVTSNRQAVSPGPSSFLVDRKSTQFGPGSARPRGPPMFDVTNKSAGPGLVRETTQGALKRAPEFIVDDISSRQPQFGAPASRPQAASSRSEFVSSYTFKRSNFAYTPASTTGQQHKQQQDTSSATVFPRVNNSTSVPKPAFDSSTIQTWICPIGGSSLREYQRSIVETGLFHNTLVCLPTGLGKTRIAATVMYNFYRWFPEGKVIFMAPTRPLVNQQIEACHSIGGFLQSDMVSMTGQMQPKKREEAWSQRRIFFTTPHIVDNDIDANICDASKIVLMVVDEAHKSTGNYPFVSVIRKVAAVHPFFRVLALSATPGSTQEAVQTIVSNLLISRIEVRTDESEDVKVHMHAREIEKIEVSLGDAVVAVRDAFKKLLSVPIKFLQDSGALYRKNVSSLAKGAIFTARAQWRMQNNGIDEHRRHQIEQNFALALSLYHGNGLLLDHGITSFKKWVDNTSSKRSELSALHQEMLNSAEWKGLVTSLGRASSTTSVGHPKIAKLEEIITAHFQAAAQQRRLGTVAADTKAIIFTQYRDSVNEIVAALLPFAPLVRATAFIGQNKGLTQKQQLQVMKEFRDGVYNVLVATSIGEEGLDVGQVDLIVCFDAQASPQRMVQRMGRTGRQRDGRIVLLMSPGERFVQKRAETKNQAMVKSILDTGSTRYQTYRPPTSFFPEDIVIECKEEELPQYGAFIAATSRKSKAAVAHEVPDEQEDESTIDFISDAELKYLQEFYGFDPSSLTAPKIQLAFTPGKLTPVGRIPHSDRSKSYINLRELMLLSDVGSSNSVQELRQHLQAKDIMAPPAPKRRKVSDIKPMYEHVSEEKKLVCEEGALLAPLVGISAPTESRSPAGDNELYEANLELYSSSPLNYVDSARETSFECSQSPIRLQAVSEERPRSTEFNPEHSEPGHVPTSHIAESIPRAPGLFLPFKLDGSDFVIPDFDRSRRKPWLTCALRCFNA